MKRLPASAVLMIVCVALGVQLSDAASTNAQTATVSPSPVAGARTPTPSPSPFATPALPTAIVPTVVAIDDFITATAATAPRPLRPPAAGDGTDLESMRTLHLAALTLGIVGLVCAAYGLFWTARKGR